ncbi:N-acetylmuramic acid 6-phosphate etherase [Leifsonia sp. LS1]|uniref:N-acetylmuramic acid 6-phosphate etherase n=1 Tax=Leifsonia sp. LS1 TaxID=2828483 RepID=UPI001CFCE091|nr:N-acetylmuramic acid 6-phosphate etherase [Leifsonia sp. LS1]GIT79733.1 N-acetylmuramic acid 6-phosphate etherase [Leifsonia sp. LS1]
MSRLTDLTGRPRDVLHRELDALTTESVASDLGDLDTFETSRLVSLMNENDSEVPAAVRQVLPRVAAAIDDIAARMRAGGRLIYVGAGTAGRLGVVDASECPPTFDVDPSRVVGVIAGGETAIRTAVEDAEDDRDGGAAAMAAIDVTPLDSVVGLSASGRTPFVSGALEFARSAGALTVAVACNRDSAIGRGADHVIEVVVGPEFIAGSTRLKAGTAQKLVLNMISTVTMVRLGKTYGNIMVDLRATNEKLRVRAERIVMFITGCAADEAAAALEGGGGSVQVAVLMLLRDLSPEDAAELVESSDSLRTALAGA